MKARLHSVAMQASVLTAYDAMIDARSPAEYAEDHLPGAISLPVLDDEERTRVGTLYKQVSPFAARKLGAALVAKSIGCHLETVLADRPKGWRPLVYCWRGGKRSGAFAHVLREVGWDAQTLEGGYRSYRRFVVGELCALPRAFSLRVIRRFGANQQLRRQAADRRRREDLRQQRGRDLAAAAPAVAVLGEADSFGCIHEGRILIDEAGVALRRDAGIDPYGVRRDH